MANPLQPKCIAVLEAEYNAFVINTMATSKAGVPDLVACVPREGYGGPSNPEGLYGMFYGFEIKWKNDTPSDLQKQKINNIIDAGGKAYFIRSVEQLRFILDNDVEPERFDLSSGFVL